MTEQEKQNVAAVMMITASSFSFAAIRASCE